MEEEFKYEEGKTYSGTVKFFNHKNKFGFVRVDDDGAEIYVHGKHVLSPIQDDDKVSFKIEPRKRGPIAIDVEPSE